MNELKIPPRSQRLIALGSGKDKLEPYLQKWATSDVGGTSRSIFSSICEFLRSHEDAQTGGPPQLVGLFRQGPGRSLYRHNLSQDDFAAMAKLLEKRQGKFILSLNDVPEVRAIFSQFKIEAIKLAYSAQPSVGRRYGEVLITNF